MNGWRTLILLVATTLALTWPSLAVDTETNPRIVVSGDGEVDAAPDMVTITLGVETRNESASVAAAENAEKMNNTINALLDAGVPPEDIQTSRYSIRSSREDCYDDCEKLPLEFVVQNQVTISMNITEGEDVSKILDASVAAGTNEVVGISFGLRDPKPLMSQALDEAVKDAMNDAQIIATAAGLTLGKIMVIDEGYSFAPKGAEVALLRSVSPIMTGTLEVTATVTVTYEIVE